MKINSDVKNVLQLEGHFDSQSRARDELSTLTHKRSGLDPNALGQKTGSSGRLIAGDHAAMAPVNKQSRPIHANADRGSFEMAPPDLELEPIADFRQKHGHNCFGNEEPQGTINLTARGNSEEANGRSAQASPPAPYCPASPLQTSSVIPP
jgi:hypothetical protein